MISAIPVYVRRSLQSTGSMLLNYFKVSIRQIHRHKVYSAINILGLALGIASCVLIYLYVQNEFSYDTFHLHKDTLYRVYITEDPPERDAFSYVEAPWHLAEALEQSFPEIEQAVRMVIRSDVIQSQNKSYTQRYHLVDPDFFEIFSFPLLSGSRDSVLQNSSSVVLTESAAERYFGNQDPLGQLLSIKLGNAFFDFRVSGIARDAPPNSSIQFEMLIPLENARKYIANQALDNWFNVFFETYVLMSQPLLPSEMEAKLQSVVNTHYPEEDAEIVTLHLQPMSELHLSPNLPVGFEGSSDPLYSYILMAIALFILGVACINFMTLSVGRAATRAREVGVRKVLGASSLRVVWMFTFEFTKLVILANIIAWPLAFFVMKRWLLDFAYRTSLGVDKFILSALAALVIALLTVSFQSIRAALADPVQTLKYE